MASARCSTCGIHYPQHVLQCPVCDSPTWYDPKEEPDEWWEWRSTMLLQEKANSGAVPPSQPYYLQVEAIPLNASGAFAISVQAVYDYEGKKRMLREGDIIQVPRGDWKQDDENADLLDLFDVIGVVRPKIGGTHYLCRRLRVTHIFPPEWERETQDGN